MTKTGRRLAAGFAAALLIAALCACQKQEGPAERAGREIDNAVDNAGKHIEKAGEDIQDAAKGDKK